MKINNNESQFDQLFKDVFKWRYEKLLPLVMDGLRTLLESEYRILFLLHNGQKSYQEVSVLLKTDIREIEDIAKSAYVKIHDFLDKNGLGKVYGQDFIAQLLDDFVDDLPELFADSYYILDDRLEVTESDSDSPYIFELFSKENPPQVFASKVPLGREETEKQHIFALAASNEGARPWVIELETGRDELKAFMFKKEDGFVKIRFIAEEKIESFDVSLLIDEGSPIHFRVLLEEDEEGRYIAQRTLPIEFRPSSYVLTID